MMMSARLIQGHLEIAGRMPQREALLETSDIETMLEDFGSQDLPEVDGDDVVEVESFDPDATVIMSVVDMVLFAKLSRVEP